MFALCIEFFSPLIELVYSSCADQAEISKSRACTKVSTLLCAFLLLGTSGFFCYDNAIFPNV